MGKWARDLFGREKFSSIGFVLAGTINKKFEKQVLRMFDKVVSSKDSVYHAHLVKKAGRYYPLVANVYGGPAMMDVLTEMYDGGCRTVIFIGSAYGGFRKNLEVGSIVIPKKSFHFDGIYSHFDPSKTVSTPNPALKKKVKEILDKCQIEYSEGSNISVPAVTFQLPHANEKYRKIKPVSLEMELASCLSRARDIGMRACGILVISDNRTSSIRDSAKNQIRRTAKLNVVECCIKNIAGLNILPLKTKREFNIDEHLASIIDSPEDVTNVYRRKNLKLSAS
jgi:purine-nucleoside phosphorylase